MILDAETFAQVAAVDKIVARRRRAASCPGRSRRSCSRPSFETNTDVCATAGEALRRCRVLRRAAADAAAREGLAIAAAGTHPFARPEAQPIVNEPRYVTFVGYGGISVRRQGVRGCTSTSACRAPRTAGAASSEIAAVAPGRARAVGELAVVRRRGDGHGVEPRAGARGAAARGAPPAFASYAEWEAWVERLVRLGVAERLHAHLVGRPPASQARHARGADCRTSRRTFGCRPRSPRCCRRCARPRSRASCRERHELLGDRGRADYVQNRWAAARFGPRASSSTPTATGRDRGASSAPSCWSSCARTRSRSAARGAERARSRALRGRHCSSARAPAESLRVLVRRTLS